MRHAMVPSATIRRDIGRAALSERIREVAAVDTSDADFVSCYLDLGAGLPACDAFVISRAAEVRASLQGAVRLDFEYAVEAIREALQALFATDVDPRSGSVALFARGPGTDQRLEVIRTRQVLEPGFSFDPIPDLFPLARLDRKGQPFTLVLGRRGSLQLLEIRGDTVTSRAWAAYRVAGDSSGARREIVLPQQRFRALRRMLAVDSSTPLIIAGDGDCLDELTAALPSRAAGRLRDVLRVPAHLDQQGAIEHVRRRFDRHLDRQEREVADRILRDVRHHGLIVAGPIATFEALRAGAVETLVLGHERAPSTATWHCADCDVLQSGTPAAVACASCGGSGLREWQAEAELTRLAYRSGIPVLFVASAELRQLGGAGCLLRKPVEIEIMPRPAAEDRALDLVA